MAVVSCTGCGEELGEAQGPNAELKARRVTVSNGRLRVKCARCHTFSEVPGLVVTSGGAPTPRRSRTVVVVTQRAATTSHTAAGG